MKNMTIRLAAKERTVPLWEVAKVLKISEPTMTRRLREELPIEETEKILSIIDSIAAEREK